MTQERSSKRQRELLMFVDGFIKGNGYGPSYREIMRALGYKSVSTVAIHIDNLIAKGYLVKRTRSARSLEVVTLNSESAQKRSATHEHKTWILHEIDRLLAKYVESPSDQLSQDVKTLVEILRIAGWHQEYREQSERIQTALGARVFTAD